MIEKCKRVVCRIAKYVMCDNIGFRSALDPSPNHFSSSRGVAGFRLLEPGASFYDDKNSPQQLTVNVKRETTVVMAHLCLQRIQR